MRRLKLRVFRHLPKELYEVFIQRPCVECYFEHGNIRLWLEVMMGTIEFEEKEYVFCVLAFKNNHFEIQHNYGIDDYNFSLYLRCCLAYVMGYLGIEEFDLEVKYKDVV